MSQESRASRAIQGTKDMAASVLAKSLKMTTAKLAMEITERGLKAILSKAGVPEHFLENEAVLAGFRILLPLIVHEGQRHLPLDEKFGEGTSAKVAAAAEVAEEAMMYQYAAKLVDSLGFLVKMVTDNELTTTLLGFEAKLDELGDGSDPLEMKLDADEKVAEYIPK